MKKLLASVSLLAMCHVAVAQVAYTVPSTGIAPPATPAGQQLMISGTPWVNGRGAVQGPNWRDNYQIIHDILNGMGTWNAQGVFTPSIGGLPPSPSATVDATNGANVYSNPFGTPRSALARAMDTYNLLDFGAKCDGSTDDTVAIKAWAAAGTFAKRLVAPVGTCNFKGPINFVGNEITVSGQGKNTTFQNVGGSVDGFVFGNGAGNYLNEVDNLRILYPASVSAGRALVLDYQSQFRSSDLLLLDAFTNLDILGGAEVHFNGLTSTSGEFWSSLVPNSSGIVIRSKDNPDGSMKTNSSGVYFTDFSIGGNNGSTQTVDNGALIQSADGAYFNGGGHMGTNRCDINIAPANNRTVQSILSAGTYFDGSFQGGSGLCIPKFSGTGQSASQINLIGGVINNHVNGGINAQEPTADWSAKAVEFKFERGWCAQGTGNNVDLDADSFIGCGLGNTSVYGGVSLANVNSLGVRSDTFASTQSCLNITGGVYATIRGNLYAGCAGGTPSDTFSSISATGDISGANINASASISAPNGTVSGANIKTPGTVTTSGVAASSDIITSGGSVTAAGGINGLSFAVKNGGTTYPGVSCSSPPSSAYMTVNGLVTHC